MIGGVSHIGIGVSNMTNSLAFFRDALGYKKIGEYSGIVNGMPCREGNEKIKSNIVLLKSEAVGPIGQGLIMLVQILPPFQAAPLASNYAWGDIGMAEAAIHVRDVDKAYERLVLKGFKAVLPPISTVLDGEKTRLCYVKDPDGSFVELINWSMWNRPKASDGIEGLNHVAFGVADVNESIAFYQNNFGFNETVFDFEGYMPLMAPMLPDQLTKMRIVLLTNEFKDAWIEIVQHTNTKMPRSLVTQWGQIGPMEFGIRVSNIESVYKELLKKGVEFKSPLQKTKFDTDLEWKYAYVAEPNGICLSIVEY